MKVDELIGLLRQQPADREVLAWATDEDGVAALCRITSVSWDAYWPGGPTVAELRLDRSVKDTEIVSNWLDNEGPLDPEEGS